MHDNTSIPQELDFGSLTTTSIPVKNLYGKNYVLKEATADAVIRYKNAQQRAATLSADGKQMKIDGVHDAEPLLLSLCLFELYEHKNEGMKERPVSVTVIRTWQSKVQDQLVELVKKISGMDEDEPIEAVEAKMAALQKRLDKLKSGAPANETAKNEQGATTGISA